MAKSGDQSNLVKLGLFGGGAFAAYEYLYKPWAQRRALEEATRRAVEENMRRGMTLEDATANAVAGACRAAGSLYRVPPSISGPLCQGIGMAITKGGIIAAKGVAKGAVAVGKGVATGAKAVGKGVTTGAKTVGKTAAALVTKAPVAAVKSLYKAPVAIVKSAISSPKNAAKAIVTAPVKLATAPLAAVTKALPGGKAVTKGVSSVAKKVSFGLFGVEEGLSDMSDIAGDFGAAHAAGMLSQLARAPRNPLAAPTVALRRPRPVARKRGSSPKAYGVTLPKVTGRGAVRGATFYNRFLA